MLDKNTFVVARHDHDLLDFAVKHSLYFCSWSQCYGHAIVERKLEVRVDRMETLAEMIHYRPVRRPWKPALVRLKLFGQSVVYRLPLDLPGTAFPGFPGAFVFCGLTDESFDFPVEGIDLPLLPGKILLVFFLVPFKLADKIPRIPFLGLKLVHLRHSLRTDCLGFLFHHVKGFAFFLKLGLGLDDFRSLDVHLAGKVAKVPVSSESLTEVVTCQNVHVPDFSAAVHIGSAHESGIMG